MTAAAQAWPISTTAGSWTLPRHTATTQGSQARSVSQSSQGRRHEALGCRVPNGQMSQKMPERDSRSPRSQTSRRAPSYTHLQATGAGTQTNGSTKAPPAVQPDVQDEASMNNLRQSLLQHIQSVQREIARLQLERRKAQQGSCEGRPHPEQADSISVPPSNMVFAASPPVGSANVVSSKVAGSAVAAAPPLQSRFPQPAGSHQPLLSSPQASTRAFSCDRSSSERASERWRKPGPRREPQLATSLQGSLLVPVAPVKHAASVTVPVLGGGSMTMSSPLQGRVRTTSPSRLEGPKRGTSPQHGLPSAKLASAKLNGTGRAAKHEPSPSRHSLGSTRGRAPLRAVRSNASVVAAVCIQRFWRRTMAKRKRTRRRSTVSTQSSARHIEPKRRRFVAVHCAAARIQRCWKLHQWRQKFVNYSVRENAWLGSLEWLQKHNLLYGTELADQEDVEWWLQQRSTAPFDREVDPWGSERLLEHLNRMWYGGRSTEVVQQQQQEEKKHPLVERQERSRLRDVGREQRSEDIFSAFASVGAWSNGKPVLASGRAPVASSLQVLPSGIRQVSMASAPGNSTGPSLSPRFEMTTGTAAVSGAPWMTNGGTPTGPLRPEPRLKGTTLAAPPPSMHGYQRSYRVASHSPPQTHRTTRATVPATPTLALSSLRARSPVQTFAGTTPSSSRLSLPCSSSMQTRSLGTVQRQSSSMNRAHSGSPPPSVVGAHAARSPVASRR